MKRLLFVALLFVGLTGCQFGCNVEKTIATGLAGGIASTLVCANVTAIQANVATALNITKVCTALENCDLKRGTVANMICPLVAATAVSFLGNKIPAEWQCQPAAATQTVASGVASACELLPF